MAVKFSQFTDKTNFADVDKLVGYAGAVNVQIPPANLDTTYALSTTQATNDVNLTLTGTKTGATGTTEDVLFVAGTAISLTAGTDQITIANTGVTSFTNSNGTFISAATANSAATGAVTTGVIDLSATGTPSASNFLRGDNTWAVPASGTDTTYSIDVPAATTNINLAGSDGSNDAITLTGGTDITLTHTSTSEITINSTATGDTYDLNSTTDGSNVDLNLTSGSGTDNSTVQLTAGTGMTITQSGGNNVTFESSAGVTVTKEQFTGNNSTTVFTLSTSTTTDNINIFISGVYQNSKDSSGAANYAVTSGTTLTFTAAPPTTATNGIEIVITQ